MIYIYYIYGIMGHIYGNGLYMGHGTHILDYFGHLIYDNGKFGLINTPPIEGRYLGKRFCEGFSPKQSTS